MEKILYSLFILIFACSISTDESTTTISNVDFILPFSVGQEYYCSQAFNTSGSHQGSFKYSVDFDMPIGTLIRAAQSGVVVHIEETYTDNISQAGKENVIIIQHDDSTYSRYAHITHNGAIPTLGQIINIGDSIAYSGNTGTYTPHLHFDITGLNKNTGRAEQTIAFKFSNTGPFPAIPQSGYTYKALKYK